MDLDLARRSQRCLDDMLPGAEDHLRLRIPYTHLNRNLHITDWTDHHNTLHRLGAVSNILIRPLLRCLPTGTVWVPDVELVVVGKDRQTATMPWCIHDGE